MPIQSFKSSALRNRFWDQTTQFQYISYLIVAGGGGGTANGGGGGGAGGVIAKTEVITAWPIGNYTVTIGNGGAIDTVGQNSVFGSYTAFGGGHGDDGQNPISRCDGGSGGGGLYSRTSSSGTATQTGTDNYGNRGGYGGGISSSTGGGGGGGGAGTQGGDAVNSNPFLGFGGTGISGLIVPFIDDMGSVTNAGILSGGNYYFAGGGAGGASGHNPGNYGGLGGGGSFNTAGTANTGGGGGSGGAYGNPVDNPQGGGSGIVIVRYTAGSITATGGTITTSGGYTYHKFTSSGTFARTA